jgi:hypothetical protein
VQQLPFWSTPVSNRQLGLTLTPDPQPKRRVRFFMTSGPRAGPRQLGTRPNAVAPPARGQESPVQVGISRTSILEGLRQHFGGMSPSFHRGPSG